MWLCKAGVEGALSDIKHNHPNDMVSLVSFSQPQGYTPTRSGLQTGYYNATRAPLSRNYNGMINSLYFPTYVIQNRAEINPYDPNMTDVPRAVGGTCYAMGLMLAYNQFARGVSDSVLRTWSSAGAYGQAGGLGRKGAQKLVIFETDGVCSATAYDPSAGIGSIFDSSGGPYNSYFKVRFDAPGSARNEYPPYVAAASVQYPTSPGDQALAVATQICAADTANPPGFTTARKPVRVYSLAFGSLFQNLADPRAQQALNLLNQIQTIGGVTTPVKIIDNSTPNPPSTTNPPLPNMAQNLQNAMSNIMQDGYSVTLVR
jgi:hypothetical protein